MKVFVSGGTGFVGTALIPFLINSEKISRVYMLFRNEATFNEEIKEFVKNTKIELVKGDVLKLESL